MLFLFTEANCQVNINSITASLNQYQLNNFQEKIFVHTDKTYYLTGEIIWLKLYNVDAGFHRPINLSKVAYVEIIDAANKPVLQTKILLKNGNGDGSLYITLPISSGNYKLRAYTNWMKNFDPAIFFEKSVSIINLQKPGNEAAPAITGKYDVQFFPEGGNLVAGLKSNIAFKAVDQNAKSVFFTAVLLDNNDTILKFKPEHAGIGNFYFTPQSNHFYKAVINFYDGKTISKDLPKAYQAGYVMHLAEENAHQIKVTVQSAAVTDNEIFLFVHSNAVVVKAEKMVLQNNTASFIINKSLLSEGICYFTLFDNNKQPVCERLYFKKPERTLQIELKTAKAVYTARNKVSVNIQLNKYADNKKDSASLSMSVFRLDSLQAVDETTIETYLLLTSDLKGSVEDPSYYFTGNKDHETDNLMLTHGWRKFNWDKILQNENPVFSYVPENNGHIITGKVINNLTGKTEQNIESYLSVPGTKFQFYPSISDSAGHVKFEMKDFYNSSEIIVQAGTQYDSVYRVEIDNPFCNNYSLTTLPYFHLPKWAPHTLLERSIGMQVQNIYTGDKIKLFKNPAVDTAAFYLTADKNYLLDNYTRFTTMEEVLREYVVNVFVTKSGGKYHFPVYDEGNKILFTSDPLNLLDGVPVFNFNKFLTIDPMLIKKLEVVSRQYILGSSSFNGILSWTSYKGDLANYELDAHSIILDYDALQVQREFYSPQYKNEKELSSHLPDFRNVLMWMPDITIGDSGNKNIEFYTSELPGKYAMLVQGIAANGLCGSQLLYFNVEK